MSTPTPTPQPTLWDQIRPLLTGWVGQTITFLTALAALLTAVTNGSGSTAGPAPSPSPTAVVSSPAPSSPAPASSSPAPPSSPAPATSSSAALIGCFPHPSVCGYPDVTNTGATGNLTPSGSITKTIDGQVIQDLAITGHITVTSANVTIRNVSIVGDASLAAIDAHSSTGPVTVDHVTITYPTGVFPVSAGAIWGGKAITVTASNISGSPDGIDASDNPAIITDNWIHDLQYNAVKATHDDTIQTLGGDITIRHNTLDATAPGTNSCLQVGNLLGNLTQLTFADNLCDGGGYSINANSSSVKAGTKTAGPMVFTGNRFGPDYKYGVKAHLGEFPDVTWTGNTADATGAIIN